MDFYNVLEQVLALLQRHQRVTYRAMQRQFGLDEEALADLKDALLYAHPEVRDDAGRGLRPNASGFVPLSMAEFSL